jgi:CBS domain-containing protein
VEGGSMKVGMVYKKFSGGVDTVKPNTPIKEVIDVFMKSKKRRNVYVVDNSRNLIGVVTVNEIFTSVRPDISPNKIVFFLKKSSIKTAKDVMVEPETVTLDDNLEDALRTAKAFKLHDVPVCEKGELVGELDAFELVYGLMISKKKTKK